MSNPRTEYNDTVRASLPNGMEYDVQVNRYIVNTLPFVTYLEALWYLRYLEKSGYTPPPPAIPGIGNMIIGTNFEVA